MTPARRKRPAPERDHPKRGDGTTRSAGAKGGRTAFSIDAAVGEGIDVARRFARTGEATVEEGLDTARRIARESEAAVKGVVERGVDTAYMVIEEYMLRGRKAAGRHHERKNGSETMADKQPNGNDWMAAMGPMAPLMGPFMATMKMWTDTMAQMAPGGPAAGRAWMEQMMAMGAPWWGAGAPLAPRLSYEVSSAAPAEVSATIDPMGYFAKLTIDALKPAGDSKHAPIKDVGITAASGHVCVRVSVPDGQPTGRYTGLVNDDTGARRGEVTLELKARAGAAAAPKS